MSGMSPTDLTVMELVREVSLLKRKVTELDGERQRVEIRRKDKYGRPGAYAMIALKRPRSCSDYCVAVEVAGCEGGNAGDIVISGKLRNGFRVEYRGCADKVLLNMWVTGDCTGLRKEEV